MKYLLLLILLITTNDIFSQKVYLTREGVQRLTKQLNDCRDRQNELLKLKVEMSKLKQTLNEKDSIFEITRKKLDTIIDVAEQNYKILEIKYNEALGLIPERKKRKLK
jgi:glucosamine 6-phosphate synthetase-like amidotransferase/phosphosugar isomerase protein